MKSNSIYLLGKKDPFSHPSFQRYHQLIEKCAKEGEFLSFESTSDWLSCYQRDAQIIYNKCPILAFRPHSTHHIPRFLQTCYELDIPVTIRCGGTGLAGGCVPSKESVVILTGHLKQIKEYNIEKGKLCIEPGVTVRQINLHVASGGWYFPLLMATDGVAGMAGCLSCNSRGYHQQQQSIFDAVERVLLVDGQGQTLEVPSSLVCGAEGIWGVIIEIEMQLKKRPSHHQEFFYLGTWQDLLSRLPLLRSLHSLVFVIWFQNTFYLGLEGEGWRLQSQAIYLAKHLPGIQSKVIKLPIKTFLPSHQHFMVISSTFHPNQLPDACCWSLEQAHLLQLECLQQVDLLAGSLHLILQTKENLYIFRQSIEKFLILWANFIDHHQAVLVSCHGIGMQMSPYMTPFWTEESQRTLCNITSTFDPKNLFSRERFFPISGKSLEKAKPVLIK